METSNEAITSGDQKTKKTNRGLCMKALKLITAFEAENKLKKGEIGGKVIEEERIQEAIDACMIDVQVTFYAEHHIALGMDMVNYNKFCESHPNAGKMVELFLTNENVVKSVVNVSEKMESSGEVILVAPIENVRKCLAIASASQWLKLLRQYGNVIRNSDELIDRAEFDYDLAAQGIGRRTKTTMKNKQSS